MFLKCYTVSTLGELRLSPHFPGEEDHGMAQTPETPNIPHNRTHGESKSSLTPVNSVIRRQVQQDLGNTPDIVAPKTILPETFANAMVQVRGFRIWYDHAVEPNMSSWRLTQQESQRIAWDEEFAQVNPEQASDLLAFLVEIVEDLQFALGSRQTAELSPRAFKPWGKPRSDPQT